MDKFYKLLKLFLILAVILVFLSVVIIFLGKSTFNKISKNTEIDNSPRLKIYTSVYPIYDFVSKIGKDKVEIVSLIRSGEDAHSFEPTAKDLMGIENADIVFYNGAGLETWIDKIQKSVSNKNLKFVNLSETVDLISGESDSHDDHDDEHNLEDHSHSHEYDPHIWLSSLNVVVMANVILENLSQLDPQNSDYYTSNYTEFVDSLVKLHLSYIENLSSLNKNEILVTHKAYGYLCELYGISQISINEGVENGEASPSKLIEIIKYIKDNNIKYILTDGLSSQKIAESIMSETGSEILVLSTLESLSEEEILNNDDFFSIMYKNLDVLKLALS